MSISKKEFPRSSKPETKPLPKHVPQPPQKKDDTPQPGEYGPARFY